MQNAINKLTGMGHKVFYSPESTYLHFTDGQNIGYMQQTALSSENWVDISSVYQPSSAYGTGRGIADGKHTDDITKETIEMTLKASKNAPGNLAFKSPEDWFSKYFKKEDIEVFDPVSKENINSAMEDFVSITVEDDPSFLPPTR